MSIRTIHNSHAQQSHIENKSAQSMSFEYLEKASSCHPIVQRALGDRVFNQILDEKDRKCEILLTKDKDPVGLIVYMSELKDKKNLKNCFNLKKFVVFNSDEHSQELYKNILLKRAITLANRKFSKTIIIQLPENSLLFSFFKDNKFKTIIDGGQKKNSTFKTHLLYLSFSSEKKDLAPSLAQEHQEVKHTQEEPMKKQAPLKRSLDLFDTTTVVPPPAKRQKIEPIEKKNPSLMTNQARTSNNPEKFETPNDYTVNPVNQKRINERPLKPSNIRTHKLPMKGTEYFHYIMDGKKQFEGRVYGPACKKMAIGDSLRMFDNRAGWGIVCAIVSKDIYKSFDEMLRSKGVLSMLPQLGSRANQVSSEQLINEGVKIYQAFPGANRVRENGAVAIGVKFIEKI